VILIPAFAVGRAQQILYYLWELRRSGRIPEFPMFLNSPMAENGRVLHHLKAFAGDERNTILLTRFQAAGTRGEALKCGKREIKVHGEYIQVRAQIAELENISAHADYAELVSWLEECDITPRRVFVTHGEPIAADELRLRFIDHFGWHAMGGCAAGRASVKR
jgi:metallo-beta-lactamase family protein